MNKEEIIQMLKDNPIKIIKYGDIEIPVEYLKQTTVNVNGDDYIRLQEENKQLKEDIKNIIRILEKNCDDLEATEEEFDSLDKWQGLQVVELEQGSDRNE